MSETDTDSNSGTYAVILDVLHHGRSDAAGSAYRDVPVAYGVSEEDFTLYEFALAENTDISIGDHVQVEPSFDDGIDRGHSVDYDDLTDGARSELDYVVAEIIEDNEERFVNVFNEAGAVSLRQHQLDLLPGIGQKLRDKILDERRREPFESFEELEERVSGLHDPEEVIEERIFEEITDNTLKYHLFTRS
ncbi:DUF655 domain-containing protein [Halocalculus aciditolerans]|uniref:Adenosine deaminase n=1 Tax=Halocalculus aciditolerans TaxID=1383812 RepID=A0A830FA41_9EURY|nr:DUF655 domain-containing protein [Halocalculus aciditolerans]GGL54772.1 adenosine deaminase [Halocalculus aciditolerans]